MKLVTRAAPQSPPPLRTGFPPPMAARNDTGWRVGQNVMQPNFGPGVIVSAAGRGADARVRVNFRNAGLK